LTCADAAHLPFKDGSFELVLCSKTLEHIVDDGAAIRELRRICGNACVITVPSFSSQRAKTHFKPDVNCTRDSHLRKYLRSDLEDTLGGLFGKVTICDLSSWYLSSAGILMHMFLPKRVASGFGYFFSKFAALDYRLSKAGAHGYSFICICKTAT